jgi:hypothetical protein
MREEQAIPYRQILRKQSKPVGAIQESPSTKRKADADFRIGFYALTISNR